MGFRLETYSDNTAQLIVDFLGEENFNNYYAGDSIQEAIQYFKLYFNSDNSVLNIPSPAELGFMDLEINPSEAKDFRENLDLLINNLSDEEAEEVKILYPQWNGNNIQYFQNERVRYQGVLYRVLLDHTSQPIWNPADSSSLFDRVLKVNKEPSEWIQPNSTNGYMKGDLVIYNEIIYESLVDNNVWVPGSDETLWKSTAEESSVPAEYDSTMIYHEGDKVIWNEQVYISLIDNNSWSPTDYPAGWSLQE